LLAGHICSSIRMLRVHLPECSTFICMKRCHGRQLESGHQIENLRQTMYINFKNKIMPSFSLIRFEMTAPYASSWNDVMAAIVKVWCHIRIYLKNNSAKFHLKLIWNDRAVVGFFEEVAPTIPKTTTTRWVAIWDQFLIKKWLTRFSVEE